MVLHFDAVMKRSCNQTAVPHEFFHSLEHGGIVFVNGNRGVNNNFFNPSLPEFIGPHLTFARGLYVGKVHVAGVQCADES